MLGGAADAQHMMHDATDGGRRIRIFDERQILVCWRVELAGWLAGVAWRAWRVCGVGWRWAGGGRVNIK